MPVAALDYLPGLFIIISALVSSHLEVAKLVFTSEFPIAFEYISEHFQLLDCTSTLWVCLNCEIFHNV